MRNSPRRASSTTDSVSLVLLASACLLTGTRRASAQGIVISDPYYDSGSDGGDVLDVLADPTGSRLAFRAETLDETRGVLYLIPASGIGTPIPRNGNLGSTGEIKDGYLFTPDGSRILYRSDEQQNGVFHLFSALADGSGVPVKLSSAPIIGPGVLEIECSPDGSRAVFLAQTSGRVHLYTAPIDGGSPMVRLDPTSAVTMLDFAVSPDSTRVAYITDKVSGRFELFVSPIDGSAPGIRLNPALPAGRNVNQLAIAPAGNRVAYRADQDVNDVFELYSAPIDASAAAVKLNPALSGNEDIVDFAFTPAGQVLFLSEISTHVDVFRVPGDGSVPASMVNPPLVAGGSALDLRVAPVGAYAVYRADQDVDEMFELYSFPVEGPGTPTKISGTMPANGAVTTFVIGPDGTRLAYVADQETDGVEEVFTTATDGSQTPVKLVSSCPCSVHTPSELHFSPEGDRVAFRSDFEVANRIDFYSGPADGSQPAERLNKTLPVDGDVQVGLLVGGGRAVYIADQHEPNVQELFEVAADGSTTPRRVKVQLFPVTGDVQEPVLSPSGQEVVYRARQSSNQFDVFKARLDGTRNSIPMTDPMPPLRYAGSFRFSADGSRLLYRSNASVQSAFELYSVPMDGSGGPVRLNDAGQNTDVLYEVGDTRVVYYDYNRLFSVPPDGSQAPVRLDGTVQPGGFVAQWLFHRGTGRVAYLAQEQSSLRELYSVPIDGSLPSVRINTPLVSGQVEDDFTFSPDGATLVYRAGTPPLDVLFAAPSDGSAGPIQLNAPLVAGGRVNRFWVSPDGAHVVYRADQETQGVYHLYAVPIDGSATPLVLTAPLPAGATINDAAISPDGNWVVYRSDLLVANVVELFSVPLTGGTSTRLSHVTAALGDVQNDYLVSPGNVVLFRGDLRIDNVFELFAVPVAGGVPEVRLHPALSANFGVQPGFALVPGPLPAPERVLFVGKVGVFDELWSAPLDGSRPAHLESRRDPAGQVLGFLVPPQGRKVVFTGYQRSPTAQELYLSYLGGPTERKGK